MEISISTTSEMPTCMVIGDPHFKQNEFYLQRVEEMGNQFIELCEAKKPDFIVVLGDTLHDHRKIDMVAQCKAVRFLRSLSKISPLFVLIGNHDRINNSDFLSDISPFEALKDWKNTYIVDKPYTLKLNSLYFYFVPYVQPSRFSEALKLHNIDPNHFHLGFSHQEYKGCKMGSVVSEEGDVWPYDKPIVTGHVHDQQMVPNGNGKLYINYIGTPIGHNHGEQGRKTVSLFTFSPFLIPKPNPDQFWCESECECENNTWYIYEKKFKLNVAKLKTIYMSAKDFIKYEFTSTMDPRYFRFVINEGTDAEIRLAKRSDKFSELENLGCKIHFPNIKPEIETKMEYETQFETKSFEQRVVDNLTPNLIKLYREILSTQS